MVARVVTVAFDGVEARRVDVEVQLVGNDGPTVFNIVGLPDKAVAESRERVRGAFAGIGLALPPDEELLIDLTSAGAQRIFGLAGKGRIAFGYDADFTIADLKRRETIRNSWIGSRAQWTPYDGVEVTGWPVGTIVRGQRVMWEGEVATPSRGEVARFAEALQA